jgi:hypothetical protein
MREPQQGLSRGDKVRVGRAVTFTETLSRETVNVTPLPGMQPATTPETVVWPAECTDLTLTDSYLYPGRVWTLEAIPPAMTWAAQDCWLRYSPGQETNGKVGQIFWAKLVGWRPTDEGDFSLGGKSVYAMVPLQNGCSIEFDIAKGGYYVDVESLAGSCLLVDTSGDCPKLAVDPACLATGGTITTGCGLGTVGGALVLDLSAVVTDPFVWTDCQLYLNIGCGLTLDGGTGALVVNPVDLADDAAITALVPNPGGTTCAVGVDLADNAQTRETLVNDVLLYRVAGGKLRMSVTKTTYTNHFNVAGLHIDRTASGAETTTFDVDICDQACCDDCTISFEMSASSTISLGSDLTLSIDTLSGCTSPYTVYVDWGDGTADEIPGATGPFTVDHTYAVAGTYTITAEATDECGFASDQVTVTVTVTGDGVVTTCCPDPIPSSLYVKWTAATFTYAGDLNRVESAVWSGAESGWLWTGIAQNGNAIRILLQCVGGSWLLTWDDFDRGCDFDVSPSASQCDPLQITFILTNTCFLGSFTLQFTAAAP